MKILLALLASLAIGAAQPSVRQTDGNIEYTAANGTTRMLTSDGKNGDPVLSPDGKTVALVHLDAEAARKSHFGGLIASGWQTAAFWMKHYVAARQRSSDARAAAGLPVAVGGPSPGFTNLKWLRPVHAGETISYRLAIKGKRALRSGWGLVNTVNTGHAADGSLAFSFDARLLWPTDPAPSS